MSLADARSLAVGHRTAIAKGLDPVVEKRRSAVPTFREAARQTHQCQPSALAQSEARFILVTDPGKARLPHFGEYAG